MSLEFFTSAKRPSTIWYSTYMWNIVSDPFICSTAVSPGRFRRPERAPLRHTQKFVQIFTVRLISRETTFAAFLLRWYGNDYLECSGGVKDERRENRFAGIGMRKTTRVLEGFANILQIQKWTEKVVSVSTLLKFRTPEI